MNAYNRVDNPNMITQKNQAGYGFYQQAQVQVCAGFN